MLLVSENLTSGVSLLLKIAIYQWVGKNMAIFCPVYSDIARYPFGVLFRLDFLGNESAEIPPDQMDCSRS